MGLCVCVSLIPAKTEQRACIVANSKAVRSLIETFWGVNNTTNQWLRSIPAIPPFPDRCWVRCGALHCVNSIVYIVSDIISILSCLPVIEYLGAWLRLNRSEDTIRHCSWRSQFIRIGVLASHYLHFTLQQTSFLVMLMCQASQWQLVLICLTK